jgi:2-polyprenyl-3-methyl-5-hydroxy-6-metoxy-1,4-benzoquinol methylase
MVCEHKKRKEHRRFTHAALERCSDCGLVFVDTYAQTTNPQVFYNEYYKNETGSRFNFGIEYVIRMLRFFRAFKIFSIHPKAQSILDIGSGRGWMLYYLKKYYHYKIAMGNQPSKPALEFSRKKLGLDVDNIDFLLADFGTQKFDVITMWHVLEHVDRPESYIEKISRCLAPGGQLVIEVPNFNSWTACWTGAYWLGLDLKYHLYFFTPETLSEMLQRHHFRINKSHTFSLEYSFFISAQSIVSLLTHSDHLLFEWLQTGKLRPVIIWHIFLFVLILPLSLLINAVLFFSKKGEVLLVVASKT